MPLTIEIPHPVLESFESLPQSIRESVREHLERLAEMPPYGSSRASFVVTGRGYIIAAEVLPDEAKLVVTCVRTVTPYSGL